jgi:hypothetical protein
MIYDATTTVEDVLAAWDAGETIWSVEMGGLGPGYEQAIQVFAVEMLREFKALDWSGAEAPDGWREARDRAHERVKHYGYSGAQAGAATNIAANFCKRGPYEAVQSVEMDRRIQVSRYFPAEQPGAAKGE